MSDADIPTAERGADHTALLNRGIAHQQKGELDKAKALYEQVLRDDPRQADALHLMGLVHKESGDLRNAEVLIRDAITAADRPQYRNSLAVVLMASARYEEAEAILSGILKTIPGHADAWFNLAVIAAEQKRTASAIYRYKQVLAAAPENAEAMNNLGVIFLEMNAVESAAEYLEKSVALHPEHALSLRNLARLRRTQGRFDEALNLLRQAVPLRPNDPDLAFAYALTLLSVGRYDEGWPAYESRYGVHGNPLRHAEFPGWDGTRLDGTLLIHTEQGYGDAIQFARFIAHAAKLVQKVVVECRAAQLGLFASIPAVAETVERGADLPAFDRQIPLLRLPMVLRLDTAALPGPIPYLFPPAATVTPLPIIKGRKVGLVGGTTSAMSGADRKNLPLNMLKRLLRAPGVTFVNLQPELDNERKKLYQQHKVLDASSHIKNFDDTAAYLNLLDLVVSVDTATAHLAGALGKPVWVLLNDQNDWRWTEQTAAHWYPAARLFRQRYPGDWQSVVDDVLNGLAA